MLARPAPGKASRAKLAIAVWIERREIVAHHVAQTQRYIVAFQSAIGRVLVLAEDRVIAHARFAQRIIVKVAFVECLIAGVGAEADLFSATTTDAAWAVNRFVFDFARAPGAIVSIRALVFPRGACQAAVARVAFAGAGAGMSGYRGSRSRSLPSPGRF